MNNKLLIKNAFQTILEMFDDRNIDTTAFDMNKINESILSNAYKVGFEIVVDDIKIVFYLAERFRLAELKDLYKDIATVYNTQILVVKDTVSANNTKAISAMVKNIQFFDIKRLQFNITHHKYVPKHELVASDEVKNIMDIYALRSKTQLPLISKNDPIAKYYGLKIGDIVKITRTSITSGETIIYRCCA